MALSGRNQPQGLVRLNRSNPLARNLQLAMVPQASLQTDANGGKFAVDVGAYALGVGVDGRTLTGAMRLTSSKNVNANTPFTVFLVANGPPDVGVLKVAASIGNFWFGTSSGNWTISNSSVDTGFAPAAIGERAVVAARLTAAEFAGFKNGVKGASRTTDFPTSAGVPFQVKDYSGGGFAFLGDIALALYYNRALSDAEIAAVSANPWQLFDAPSKTQFPIVAAATGVSGGITWTEAADSTAAAGTVTVSGTAAWTEAADTVAIAGAAQVNAAGSWTEAADTTAIAASASITATASWTESADTLTMAGSVGDSVAGNISWTEANDAATIAASARVNAAGAWTEAADTVAIAASITAAPVTGTIAWTEQADTSAIATYPGFNVFTLMRAAPVSASGYISGSATQFTLMRSNPLYAASAMSAAPLNRSVNLI